MNVFDERNPNSITANVPPHNFQGRVGGEGGGLEMRGNNKFGVDTRNNRRALGVLNLNYAGAQPQAYPCVVSKRLNSDSEGGVRGTNPFNPVLHRPITRKFAAQLSSTHQALQETKKKQKPSSVPKPNAFGECIFIDHEDETKVPDIDQPVPMSLEEQTQESSIDQMDHTEEIDMEDIIEEPIMDIDRCDAKNPLAVVDYVEHLYAYYRKMESLSCVSPDYMAQQFDINEKMRAILIDWLVEVHDKFELMKETLFLTVNLIDRFLSQQPVMRKKLQLVGLVAMLLACKYEEVSVPVVGDLIVISNKAYTRKEVLEMENLMLNKLQFNMSLPTPYVFMTRFLKAAQSDKKLEMLAFYLIELSLVEYEMLKFTPSLLAASAIYTAQCSLYGFKQWSSTSQLHSNYSEDQLLECSRKIVGFHKQAGAGKLTGVYRKYNTSKFGYTSSKCEPASFLLETTQQQLL